MSVAPVHFEPQYAAFSGMERGTLGVMASEAWENDPQRLLFMLARYKFVARMLVGKSRVVEIGAADGWASRIVQQSVYRVTVTDADPTFVQDARESKGKWDTPAQRWNPIEGPAQLQYDGAYALDVLEHVPQDQESAFLRNICASLHPDGVLIIGMPSAESQRYASAISKAGHVNCKDPRGLSALMSAHFRNVFDFGLNDEVLHTGHYGMRHYLLCMGVGVRHAD